VGFIFWGGCGGVGFWGLVFFCVCGCLGGSGVLGFGGCVLVVCSGFACFWFFCVLGGFIVFCFVCFGWCCWCFWWGGCVFGFVCCGGGFGVVWEVFFGGVGGWLRVDYPTVKGESKSNNGHHHAADWREKKRQSEGLQKARLARKGKGSWGMGGDRLPKRREGLNLVDEVRNESAVMKGG